MGSVGPRYRCPWCGRVGNGGYAPDPIGYPICTEGEYSCLWFQLQEERVYSLNEFRQLQLRTIWCRKLHKLYVYTDVDMCGSARRCHVDIDHVVLAKDPPEEVQPRSRREVHQHHWSDRHVLVEHVFDYRCVQSFASEREGKPRRASAYLQTHALALDDLGAVDPKLLSGPLWASAADSLASVSVARSM